MQCLLPPSLNERNLRALNDEFAAQASKELAAGLPVSCPAPASARAAAASELGFIDFVMKPCFRMLAEFAPELSSLLTRIDVNRAVHAAAAAL